jgi:hypothetical protein
MSARCLFRRRKKLLFFCDEILSLRYASFQNDGGGGAVRTDKFVGTEKIRFGAPMARGNGEIPTFLQKNTNIH